MQVFKALSYQSDDHHAALSYNTSFNFTKNEIEVSHLHCYT
jgi:hypothetical protein